MPRGRGPGRSRRGWGPRCWSRWNHVYLCHLSHHRLPSSSSSTSSLFHSSSLSYSNPHPRWGHNQRVCLQLAACPRPPAWVRLHMVLVCRRARDREAGWHRHSSSSSSSSGRRKCRRIWHQRRQGRTAMALWMPVHSLCRPRRSPLRGAAVRLCMPLLPLRRRSCTRTPQTTRRHHLSALRIGGRSLPVTRSPLRAHPTWQPPQPPQTSRPLCRWPSSGPPPRSRRPWQCRGRQVRAGLRGWSRLMGWGRTCVRTTPPRLLLQRQWRRLWPLTLGLQQRGFHPRCRGTMPRPPLHSPASHSARPRHSGALYPAAPSAATGTSTRQRPWLPVARR
mmetsp:Transcript_17390/g.52070  ORF Transcript_17390/g.52070 Transcript_17390/m.52070 type:complete len:334 (-) Transcript_17390:371-1372(-)